MSYWIHFRFEEQRKFLKKKKKKKKKTKKRKVKVTDHRVTKAGIFFSRSNWRRVVMHEVHPLQLAHSQGSTSLSWHIDSLFKAVAVSLAYERARAILKLKQNLRIYGSNGAIE